MKKKNLITTIFLILSVIFFYSCEKNNPIESDSDSFNNTKMDDLVVDPEFNYNTSDPVTINLKSMDNSNRALANVRFDFYYNKEDGQQNKLFSGLTDSRGQLKFELKIPSYLDELIIKTNYIGLVSEQIVQITGNNLNINYGDYTASEQYDYQSQALAKTTGIYDYTYLGSYNNYNGDPYYLESTGDQIDQNFLNDINASLPERQPVPEYNPEYLANGNEINTLLVEDGSVYVTFVHEGAGYKNVLGFYSYPANSPPSSTDDIDDITIIFPNVSYNGSGGGLQSGDKVNIGFFQANTVIAWVLKADGWRSGGIRNGPWTVFSETTFNPESNSSLQQHNVILNDHARGLSILGFEDIRRDYGSCDNDYNDAIFYVTSVPNTAIATSNMPQVNYTGNDSDGDGVMNHVDDYPNDSEKAFNNYYPAEDANGTIAFEDQWPSKGDYDFNDLVLDYYFNQIMNANGEVVEIEAQFEINAVGASFENGFGFQLPISPSDIVSVTGVNVQGNIVSLDGKNLEAGQNKAVIIVTDNVYSNISRPSGYYVNTQPNAPYISPVVISINIELAQPISKSSLGSPPYNPFIFINQVRGREVHLAGHPPTDLADQSYFGTNDDNTNPNAGNYYKTSNNHPWALDLTDNADYPIENSQILNAFIHFQPWAESSGQNNADWYLPINGYRNISNIYDK